MKKINLSQQQKIELLYRINTDTSFLRKLDLIDYSLLIGIYKLDSSSSKKIISFKKSNFEIMIS